MNRKERAQEEIIVRLLEQIKDPLERIALAQQAVEIRDLPIANLDNHAHKIGRAPLAAFGEMDV